MRVFLVRLSTIFDGFGSTNRHDDKNSSDGLIGQSTGRNNRGTRADQTVLSLRPGGGNIGRIFGPCFDTLAFGSSDLLALRPLAEAEVGASSFTLL
ncbi:hypothetical protein E3N88_26571 [Mikania micrantha]|uniref:Uncharacterized protein n=1 Tax=Mikania micrantha TaxID=192012 RepID=A0A5N6MVB2_9ASTR|nr:hypothetical protein E3N88_26571 [Mikania micrantha]